MENMKLAYSEMWSRWNDFSGRSSVGKYWWAILMNWIIVFVMGLVAGVLAYISLTVGIIMLIAVGIYALALIVPGLALLIRRLHDTGRSGWWYFISWIPFVGPILLLVYTASAGDPGVNMYGPPEVPGSIRT